MAGRNQWLTKLTVLDSAENVKELNLKSIEVSLDPVSVFNSASIISLFLFHISIRSSACIDTVLFQEHASRFDSINNFHFEIFLK